MLLPLVTFLLHAAQVYTWFLGSYKVSLAMGMCGYVLLILEMFGAGPLLNLVFPQVGQRPGCCLAEFAEANSGCGTDSPGKVSCLAALHSLSHEGQPRARTMGLNGLWVFCAAGLLPYAAVLRALLWNTWQVHWTFVKQSTKLIMLPHRIHENYSLAAAPSIHCM